MTVAEVSAVKHPPLVVVDADVFQQITDTVERAWRFHARLDESEAEREVRPVTYSPLTVELDAAVAVCQQVLRVGWSRERRVW